MELNRDEAVEIGREEVWELLGYGEMPTNKREIIISRQIGLISQIVSKKGHRYYVANIIE